MTPADQSRALRRAIRRRAEELSRKQIADQRCAVLLIANEEIKRALPYAEAQPIVLGIFKRVERELN